MFKGLIPYLSNFASEQFLYSLFALGIVIGLDFFYRKCANIRIELPTVEIIIFSCVHTIYQLVSFQLLGHTTIWATTSVVYWKAILLLMLFITAITSYNNLQRELDVQMQRFISALERANHPALSDMQLEMITVIGTIAAKYIRADLWLFSLKKREERHNISKLLEAVIGTQIDPDNFLIDAKSKMFYKWWTAALALLCLLVALFPV